MFLILHNNKPFHAVITSLEDAEAKKVALESAFCLKKNFQVAESDKWEIVEVPCD